MTSRCSGEEDKSRSLRGWAWNSSARHLVTQIELKVRRTMGSSSIVTVFLLTVGVYLLAQGAPTSDVTSGGAGADHVRGGGRPSLMLPRLSGPRAAKYLRSRLAPVDAQTEDFLVDEDDGLDLNKRQSEDYGHMRFGKREEQFDDYGHMRFGRSLDH